jgi:UDP-GlcNAc:undecaprenyl-phosphate GlcNAc-1-phosphate transferase
MLADAAWLPAVPPFLLASAVCMLVIPLTMVLAHRAGAEDDPGEERRMHGRRMPRLGGIAMFAGFAMALLVFGNSIPSRWQVLAVTLAITATMAVDDILQLPPWTKLALEVAAGALVALLGITISYLALPGHEGANVIGLAWLAAPITVAWITGLQISINLIDGVDGAAAGVVGIVAVVLLLAAINRVGPNAPIQSDVIVMSGALMGCCVGFLVFNFHPARVIMGDSGSHFLGVAVGTITILGVAKLAVALSLLVPLVALGLPIGDTAFAIVRRRRAGVGIAQPDAGHLHHRLLSLGLTVRETALAFYLGTAILGCIGLAIFGHKKVLFAAIVMLVGALVALLRRNHRRGLDEAGADAYLVVPGRAALPTRARHGGEAD